MRLFPLMILTVACGAPDRDPTPWARDVDATETDSPTLPTCTPTTEIVADGVDQDCDGADLCPLDADDDGHGASSTVAVPLETACGTGGTATSADDCDDSDGEVWAEATWYLDADGDGSGDAALPSTACSPGAGWSLRPDDCDDTDPTVAPTATEAVADGVDQDCDGLELCWADRDDDDLGDPDSTAPDTLDCAQTAAVPGDCDDHDALLPRPWFRDTDSDGHGTPELPTSACDMPSGHSPVDDDCDDAVRTTHPGAPEVPYDGIDDDCDGGDLVDVDGDGAPALRVGGDDCNDVDDTVFPGAAEVPYDGVDQDCADGDLVDVDRDGWSAEVVGGRDCDDARASTHPGAPEVCGDGRDDDCDPTPRVCGLGGPLTTETADVVLRGDRVDGMFGLSIAGGEDLTGDGVPDLAIGSPGRKAPDTTRQDGAVFVASGAELFETPLEASDLWASRTGVGGEQLGTDIHLLPKRGTTAASIIAGATSTENASDALVGRVWNLTGPFAAGTVSASAAGQGVLGTSAGMPYGGRLAVGEVFGDGTLLVATTMPAPDVSGTSDLGLLYPLAFQGYRGTSPLALGRIDESTRSLRDIALGLDVVGDSRGDVVIATAGPGTRFDVTAYPSFPKLAAPNLSTLASWSWSVPPARVDDFVVVEQVADVTGDGRADLAVGAPCLAACGDLGGTVWVVPGSVSPSGGDLDQVGRLAAGTRITSAAPDTQFGASITWAGDVDGNGHGDLLIGALNDESGRGVTWLVYGPLPAGDFLTDDIGDTLPGARLASRSDASYFGLDATGIGDVDGDGYDDIAVAAPWAPGSTGQRKGGRVFVWYGGGD